MRQSLFGNGIGGSRAGLSSKVHLACEVLGYPVGFILTAANTHDYHQAKPLLKRHLQEGAAAIMDKGYDKLHASFCSMVLPDALAALLTPAPPRSPTLHLCSYGGHTRRS